MGQRFLFEEDYGWAMKIIRAVIWSGVMGLLWVVPWIVLVLFTVLCFHFIPSPSSGGGGDDALGMAVIFIGLILCSGLSFTIGGVTGLVAGIKARPEEAFWPFHSPLFRLCLEWALWIGVFMVMAVCASFLAWMAPYNLFS